MSVVAVQEFAHPQARFLHEKQRALSPRARRWLSGLLAAVNRASFKAIDGAMFVGTVRRCCYPCPTNRLHSWQVGPGSRTGRPFTHPFWRRQAVSVSLLKGYLTLCNVSTQADVLATFRKKVLRQPSLFSLKHYHRPLVSPCD